MRKAMFLAAIFAFVSIGAYAQTVKADVPFGFAVSKVQLPAGEYSLRIDHSLTRGVIQLQNAANGKSVFIGTACRSYPAANSRPRLVFRSAGGHWALAELWTDEIGYHLRLPKPLEGAKVQTATIYLQRTPNGD